MIKGNINKNDQSPAPNDFIDRAVLKRAASGKELNTQAKTWAALHKACEGKDLYIYGLGNGANFLFGCGEPLGNVSGMIDSDRFLCGKRAEARFPILLGRDIGYVKIYPPGIIDSLKPDRSVFLITTTLFAEELIETLRGKGFTCIFSLMELEHSLRLEGKYRTGSENVSPDLKNLRIERPIEQKKIIFQSSGKYSEHGKYITEELIKIRPDLDIVWMVDNKDCDVPDGVRISDIRDEWSYRYELETAHVWVAATALRTPDIKKRDGQYYVQTKHWGSVTLKRFYLDAETLYDISDNISWWKKDFQKIDYIITGSDFDTESCRKGFDFSGTVLQTGSARTDAMFNTRHWRESIRRSFGVDQDTRLLLYAPTYRYAKEKGRLVEKQIIRGLDLDFARIRQAAEKRFGGNWLIMLRLHPGVIDNCPGYELPEGVLDASLYPDGEELCAACYAMISDYSSIMFEPAIAGIPVFLFAPDREEYIDTEYDLLIKYDELPFDIASDNAELAANICGFDEEEYDGKLRAFFKQYGVHEDGHASERAAKAISDLLDRQG